MSSVERIRMTQVDILHRYGGEKQKDKQVYWLVRLVAATIAGSMLFCRDFLDFDIVRQSYWKMSLFILLTSVVALHAYFWMEDDDKQLDIVKSGEDLDEFHLTKDNQGARYIPDLRHVVKQQKQDPLLELQWYHLSFSLVIQLLTFYTLTIALLDTLYHHHLTHVRLTSQHFLSVLLLVMCVLFSYEMIQYEQRMRKQDFAKSNALALALEEPSAKNTLQSQEDQFPQPPSAMTWGQMITEIARVLFSVIFSGAVVVGFAFLYAYFNGGIQHNYHIFTGVPLTIAVTVFMIAAIGCYGLFSQPKQDRVSALNARIAALLGLCVTLFSFAFFRKVVVLMGLNTNPFMSNFSLPINLSLGILLGYIVYSSIRGRPGRVNTIATYMAFSSFFSCYLMLMTVINQPFIVAVTNTYVNVEIFAHGNTLGMILFAAIVLTSFLCSLYYYHFTVRSCDAFYVTHMVVTGQVETDVFVNNPVCNNQEEHLQHAFGTNGHDSVDAKVNENTKKLRMIDLLQRFWPILLAVPVAVGHARRQAQSLRVWGVCFAVVLLGLPWMLHPMVQGVPGSLVGFSQAMFWFAVTMLLVRFAYEVVRNAWHGIKEYDDFYQNVTDNMCHEGGQIKSAQFSQITSEKALDFAWQVIDNPVSEGPSESSKNSLGGA